MTRELGEIVLVIALLAAALLVWSQHRADPAPVVSASVALGDPPPAGPQCAPPTLDYSRRRVRLDSKGIA